MQGLSTLTYEVTGRIARITLNRPERGNAITLDMPRELAHCVELADLDPGVHVIALSGRGKGFCSGYDLLQSAERMGEGAFGDIGSSGTAMDAAVIARSARRPTGSKRASNDCSPASRDFP